MATKPNSNQRILLRRRGLDPKNYLVLKGTYSTVYFLDIRTKKIKIITKNN